ncbi:MAG: ATP-binding cassette domain-containing protein, partial [Defluviitaleaceae bacterium]|nr:ATP-binding cassette domain-containing protein [Defluviitaleaceae bacterium]
QSSRFADKAETAKMGRGAAAARKKGHDMVGSKEYQAKKSLKMQQRRKNLERRWDVAIEEKSGLLKNIERADALKISQLPFHTSRFVELRDVAIFYDGGEKAVCRDVNFTIERGDRIALCGRNGSGKSSILKLICGGDFGGDSSGSDSSEGMTHIGEISKASGLKISYVSQDTSHLAGDLSDFAAENAIDESLFKAILHKLDFSRVQFEKDMQTFSGGQKKKTLLAKSLCEKSHLLVWDEPLNFVDVLSRMQIEELLLEHTPTILFVEHDSVFCERIAAKVIQL